MKYRCVILLISLTISVNGAADEVNNIPPFDAITLIAYNTSNGSTELRYKHVYSQEEGKVLFEGHTLSYISATLHRSSNLTVITTTERILLVILPLGEYFGLASFDVDIDEDNNHSITFREKYTLNITGLGLDCKLMSIVLPRSRSSSELLIIQGVCFHQSADGSAVDFIRAEVNATHLSQSSLLPYHQDDTCGFESTELSAFVFFYSMSFKTDIFVLIDERTIRSKNGGGSCNIFSHLQLDGEVERFVSVSSDMQAIYSTQGIYILDIRENERFPRFEVAVDGFPLFCSNSVFSSLKNHTLSLHYIEGRSRIGNFTPFPYDDAIGGDCTVIEKIWFVVVQLQDGMVVSANLNSSEFYSLGVSVTFPRLFGSFILLSNETHTYLHDLNGGISVDAIEERSSLGFVMDYGVSIGPTLTSTTVTSNSSTSLPPEASNNQRTILIAIFVTVPFLLVIGACVVVFLCLWKKKGENNDPAEFRLDESIATDQIRDASETPSDDQQYPINVHAVQAEVETGQQQDHQQQAPLPPPPSPSPPPPSPPPLGRDNNNWTITPDNNRMRE